METPLSVLIVDDSALMRNLIKRMVENDPELEVAGIAMNGRFALQKIPNLKPDIIVLDLEMPEMNGIEFLKERDKQGLKIPVVILSSIATKGARVTMEALALGASDFITKPSGPVSSDIHKVNDRLIQLLKAYGNDYRRRYGNKEKETKKSSYSTGSYSRESYSSITRTGSKTLSPSFSSSKAPTLLWDKITPMREPESLKLIVLGISTGGPNALRKVFAQLKPDLALPMLVVQHMPAGFTREFAHSLDKICPLEVKEAEDGDILKPGRILIAPGDKHLSLEKRSLATIARLKDQGLVNGHKPSAGVLFQDAVDAFGNQLLAIIMTGMGKDGSREIGEIYKAGGYTIAQDEKSCIVYGMPRVAVEHEYIREVVNLDDMAETIHKTIDKYT